jgi:putative flippase GtrA
MRGHFRVFQREFITAKFIRFLFAGGFAALANIFSRVALSEWMHYVPAIICAYVVGLVTAYTLNRMFVFGKGDRSFFGEVGMFTFVNVVAIAQILVISIIFAYYVLPHLGVTSHAETIAHVIGVIVPVFTSFIGHKYWSFRGHGL